MGPRVTAVSRNPRHGFSKTTQMQVRLIENFGVEGDAHAGVTVKHRSRVAQDPTQPNLRQVHLIPEELFEELAQKGFRIAPGAMGENVATRGLDLISLPQGTRLRLGDEAVVEVTGLRNPCGQLNGLAPGLLEATIERTKDGLIRKAGVMGVVLAGGYVRPGDPIGVDLPAEPHRALERV
jgi:MOSC domain-containing protein YiiM